MDIIRSGSQPSQKVPPEYFTGSVRIDSRFQSRAPVFIQPTRVQAREYGSIDFTKALVAASDHLAMLLGHAALSNLGKQVEPFPLVVPALSHIAEISRVGLDALAGI
jgi:hypothetical protein